MAREFEIRREVELPATPEEVWEAVATGTGTAAWMFPQGEIEPRAGGKAADGSTVQKWDPPHHFAVRFEGEGGFFNAIEFVIEGREGGTTLLRYLHSGIFTDDWDNQYDAANQHTDFYLHTLAQYLEHFNGRSVTYIGESPGGINGPEAAAKPGSFAALKQALGVGNGVAEGASVTLDLDGPGQIEGVVDYARGNFVGIRTPDGLYRFFGRDAFGFPVGMQIHHFGAAVDKDAVQETWQRWLNGVYA